MFLGVNMYYLDYLDIVDAGIRYSPFMWLYLCGAFIYIYYNGINTYSMISIPLILIAIILGMSFFAKLALPFILIGWCDILSYFNTKRFKSVCEFFTKSGIVFVPLFVFYLFY